MEKIKIGDNVVMYGDLRKTIYTVLDVFVDKKGKEMVVMVNENEAGRSYIQTDTKRLFKVEPCTRICMDCAARCDCALSNWDFDDDDDYIEIGDIVECKSKEELDKYYEGAYDILKGCGVHGKRFYVSGLDIERDRVFVDAPYGRLSLPVKFLRLLV